VKNVIKNLCTSYFNLLSATFKDFFPAKIQSKLIFNTRQYSASAFLDLTFNPIEHFHTLNIEEIKLLALEI